jgi:hypothetical protein
VMMKIPNQWILMFWNLWLGKNFLISIIFQQFFTVLSIATDTFNLGFAFIGKSWFLCGDWFFYVTKIVYIVNNNYMCFVQIFLFKS